ncbi:MAG: HD domain-containing protein [Elusimicrobiota bacterium]
MIDKALEFMTLLENKGCNNYLCGGSIRDIFLDRPIKDIDITTACNPEEITNIAKQLGLKYIPTGIKHGTVTIIYNGIPIEVTTFRIDKECYGRKAEVEFCCSLEQDLARRDFTINAMAMDVDGNIIDCFGRKQDIEKRLIKAVGNAEQRFEEDQLRTLRAIRFATILNFAIDTETFEAIKKTRLDKVSSERIRDELIKILLSSNRATGIELLDQSGLLFKILPEITNLKGIQQEAKSHPEGDVYTHTVLTISSLPTEASLELILAALLHDIGKPATITKDDKGIHFYDHEIIGAKIAEEILRRLKFPVNTIDGVKQLILNHMKLMHFDKMRMSKKIDLITKPYFSDLLILFEADTLACLEPIDKIEEIYDFLREKSNRIKEAVSSLDIINGDDITSMGINQGPAVGVILKMVREKILEGEIKTREEALELALDIIENA